jgi:hypothetical protein
MKFEHTLRSRGTLNKGKYFEFKELKDKDIEFGRKATFNKPYYIMREGCVYSLYMDRGRLAVVMLHSWDKFIEVKK